MGKFLSPEQDEPKRGKFLSNTEGGEPKKRGKFLSGATQSSTKGKFLNPIKQNPNNPRNGLSKSQIAEAEGNKNWAKGLDDTYNKATKYIPDALIPNSIKTMKPSSMVAGAKGFTHNMDEYGASINKGLGKVAGAFGLDGVNKTFDKDAEWWSDQRRMNEIETEDNKIAHIAGEMITDPLNASPAGVFSKGTKLARVGKSMVAGAGVGYATSKAKNYGNDDLTDKQKANEDIMSVGITSVLNGIIAGVTRGRVTNALKDIPTTKVDEITGETVPLSQEEGLNAVIDNAEIFGLSAPETKAVVNEYQRLLKNNSDFKNSLPKEELADDVIEQSDELIPQQSEIVSPTENPPMKATPQEPTVSPHEIEDIFAHPRATEAIDLARDRYASQTYNPRVGGGSSSWVDENNVYHRSGAEGEKNYHQGFELSKADIKKIDNGKITPEIEAKLRNDIDRLENDPNWNSNSDTDKALDEATFLDENDNLVDPKTGEILFSNAGHNLAGGFGTGTVNAGSGLFDGSYDKNRPLSDQMAERFLNGFIAGVVGVSGLKLLKKTNPEAFRKVQKWFTDNDVKVGDKLPTDGVQIGVFAGKKAKNFEGKATHTGKYDGQTRFEIDDSNMQVIPTGVTELSSKGYTGLDKIIKHDELFDNYPQLRNVMVKFDKNMDSHATFDGENTITLSNKFKNKDEMSSSIIHEIQHWVQNKEGFAGGGNFDDMMMQVEGKIYNLELKGELSPLDAMNYKKDLDYLKENRSAEAYNKYKQIAGEIEAREVQARKNLTPEEREAIPNYENVDTMGDKFGDEAYNDAFMAKLDGRHGDFDSTGIHPDDATLDFSRNKSENNQRVTDYGKHDFEQTEELAKERNSRGWTDLSKTEDGVKNFGKLMKQLFTDTMSAGYHGARDAMHVAKNKSDAKIARVAKVLETIDKDTRVSLHRYLTKQEDGANLPPKVKQIGDMFRKTIDDLSDELVRAGQLDEKAQKEWKEAYLTRLYEPKIKQGFGLGSAGNVKLDKFGERGLSQEFKADDLEGMTGWLSKNGFIDDGELQSLTSAKQMVEYLKSKGKAGLLNEGKVKIETTAGGKIKLRRDWTKAERESMGEVEDALVTIPETLARMNKLKQHSDFLNEISKLDGAVVDSKVVKEASYEELVDAGYKHLEVNPKYGALSGKWVRQDVADDIGVMHKEINQLASWGEQKWRGYHGLWKKSKTVWNPTAHVNNTVGNWALMHMAGVNSTQMPKIFNRGRLQMKALSRIEDLELKKLSGAMTDAEKAEFAQLSKDAKFALEAKELGIFGRSQLNDILAGVEEGAKTSTLGKLDKWASGAYQMEDNFNRLSFYLTLRESGRDAKTSKQMVDFMLPDYTKPLPKGWRVARDTSIAPFISWSYYTMPSIVKALGTKKGATGFGKFSRGQKSVAKIMGLLSLMEYATSGGEVTPLDNLPFYNGNKPEDFKGRRHVISKNGDTITTLKTDRLLPYAELRDPVNYAKSQVSGILPNLLYTLNGQKMYDGRPVTYKNKSAGDKTVDWLKYLTKQYAPIPMPVMNSIDAVDASLRSKKSRKRNDVIKPRTTAQELLKNIGINTISYSKRGAEKENSKN